jgi:hypothetical protein
MYSLKYNHEYFAFSESKNNYLRPLGFQGGINFQYDGFRSKRFSLESFSQTSSTVFSGSSNSASFSTFYFFPIPKETNYINYSTFLNLGLTYKLDIAVNKEIEFGLNYLIGKSRGSNEFQTVGLVVGNYLPYTALTKFNSNITGSQLNIAYNYKLNEKRGFRFFMENRILNYNVNNSKTVVENITSLPVNDNGIISKVSDQMSSIGVEYYHNL